LFFPIENFPKTFEKIKIIFLKKNKTHKTVGKIENRYFEI